MRGPTSRRLPRRVIALIALVLWHTAVVSITDDTSRFSITYKSSTLLMQRGTTIHRNDNDRITKLAAAIEDEVAAPPPPK